VMAFFLFIGFYAYAQTDAPTAPSEQDIAGSLNLDQFSAPSVDIVVSASGVVGTTALLSARTSNISDNASEFQWYLDDRIMPLQSGKARTTFSFKTTEPFHLVRLVVLENGQKAAENTVSVSSFAVSLVWAADTFVPGDYEGKAMPIVGSRVTVTALPDIQGESPENLLYTWYVNSESQVRGVVNEQDFSFRITKNVSFVPVVVEVSNQSQSITVRQALTVPVLRPALFVYQGKEQPGSPPAGGSPQAGLSSGTAFVSRGEKLSVYAKPFYFHIQSANDLSYQWQFNNQSAASVPPDPNFLLLAIPKDSGTGTRTLSVSATSFIVLGEQARAELTVNIL